MQHFSTNPELKMDETIAIRTARQQGMTIAELSHYLLTDLCRGLPQQYADLALRIYHATLRLQNIPH